MRSSGSAGKSQAVVYKIDDGGPVHVEFGRNKREGIFLSVFDRRLELLPEPKNVNSEGCEVEEVDPLTKEVNGMIKSIIGPINGENNSSARSVYLNLHTGKFSHLYKEFKDFMKKTISFLYA